MSRKTAIAAAVTVMLYTRPAIVAAEGVRLTPFQSGDVDGHYAIFAEEEAQERLESGFWVDHPNKLSTLDKAIAEAERKEQEADDRAAEEERAELAKKLAGENTEEKATESTATEPEEKAEHQSDEVEKEPEQAAEQQESTKDVGEDESKPVDGAKVQTKAKAKK